MTYSESEIMEGIINNDRLIFNFLYESVGKSVGIHIYKNSGTKDDGVDFFMRGFLATRKKLVEKKYESNGKIEGYIFQVCKNLWYSELRKRKRKRDNETSITDKENWVADSTRNTEEKIIQIEEISHLNKCLKMLNEKCQEVIQMHLVDGLKLVHIAEELAEKDGTVRKRFKECKDRLKKLLSLAMAV